ncbi:MAG: 50S ribosomal protein L20 [Chitinivibrionales bacterium]|nr:50S ribosomal protein L20 [Chitinivibrionales bacterium]
MPRAKTRVSSRNRRKKIIKAAKGYFGKRKSCIRTAKDAVIRAGSYAYTGRKQKKRNFRSLWIMRINAAARQNGTTYAKLIDGLNQKGIVLNRKTLAHLAVHEPESFTNLIEQVKA